MREKMLKVLILCNTKISILIDSLQIISQCDGKEIT